MHRCRYARIDAVTIRNEVPGDMAALEITGMLRPAASQGSSGEK
jgi:hypothetical protein